MTVYLDDAIYKLQTSGGISTLWNHLTPHLEQALGAVTWGEHAPDYFLSTYYAPPPDGMESIAIVYDFIGERSPHIGRFHPDVIAKHAAIDKASACIAISEWTARDVRTITDKPVTVAYCGTELQRATPLQVAQFRQTYGLDKPYVLVVGRRHLYKNVNALYQAWRLWQGCETHMVLCIGGEDPQTADLQFAKQYPASWKHIRLSDNEMASAYTGARMLVYPSLYEGFGLPVLEALACGTAIVCGERSAIPEIAQDVPYYADVFRPYRIAERMNAALAPDLERKTNGMALAKSFTWKRMAEQIVSSIKELSNQ